MSSNSQSKSKFKSQETNERPHPENQHELTSQQQHALDQLRELTNGADAEVSMGVLRSVEWDVQRAAELIFESSSHPSSVPKPRLSASSLPSSSSSGSLSSLGSAFGHSSGPSSNRPEPFEIDDSQVQTHRPTPAPMGFPFGFHLPRSFITFLSFPFHILTTLVRFVFGVLRIPLPRLPGSIGFVRFAGLGVFGSNGSRRGDGRLGYGEPWLREVEDETGAMWLGRVIRANTGDGVASGVNTGVAGPSDGVVRRGGKTEVDWGQGKKYLPDFETCGYEEFLKKCLREKKVGCVVLVSEEHDDVLSFKRSTLVDQAFVRRLYEAGVLCWGGDVRDREAWSAAEKLQATTYPFVAFIALQPRRGTNVLTILSRHQGKASTSASTLTSHIDTHVLPRVLPFLDTLIQEEKGRDRDRQLRAEQDRAYEESRRRDREKWEKEERERMRVENERARREREEKEKVEKQKRRVEMRKKVWGIVESLRGLKGRGEGPDKGKGKQKQTSDGEVTVVIRMPGGERVVEKFWRDESVSVLYAIVDRLLAGDQVDRGAGDMTEGGLDTLIKREGGKDFWGFKIVSAYPRKEIEWGESVKIGDVDSLVGGGQVVVERDVVVNGDGDGCETEEEE